MEHCFLSIFWSLYLCYYYDFIFIFILTWNDSCKRKCIFFYNSFMYWNKCNDTIGIIATQTGRREPVYMYPLSKKVVIDNIFTGRVNDINFELIFLICCVWHAYSLKQQNSVHHKFSWVNSRMSVVIILGNNNRVVITVLNNYKITLELCRYHTPL